MRWRASGLVSGLTVISLLTSGCTLTGRWPFAFQKPNASPVAQVEPRIPNTTAGTGAIQTPVDTSSQEIAAESRALSQQYAVKPNSELEKYAKIPDDPHYYTSAADAAHEHGQVNDGSVDRSGHFGHGGGCH